MTADPSREDPWTIRRVLAWAADDLKKRGNSSPRLDAELLLGKVLDLPRVKLVIDADRPLSKEELAQYKALHQRRRSGEPVAYLLGVREFYGRPFRVDPRVLIPRPDTEILVEVALERSQSRSLSLRALDLCTGSGCVAITIARERPTARVIATDISPGALEVARDNAVRLCAFNVSFFQGDLFALPTTAGPLVFDLITANPPYIPKTEERDLPIDIRKFEPHTALFGGPDGLDILRRIIDGAPDFLDEGGVLALEVAAGQSGVVAERMRDRGFAGVETRRDYGGHERVVSGVQRKR
ncbi:MAG: peptide chain release factor N(5)-glutamine methyltransferase [Polyangiaceae bacterium]|nr:peptide chain release factor N(5)-glutamine methyltransferase [Polyangiaceae bacterium]